MAGNIKGITIEFRAKTTELDSAMRKINNETRKLDNELRKVDKALKFNPGSVQLWTQKQTILTQKVKETEEKLDALKQAQKQLDAKDVDKNSAEYRELQREIIECESKLKTFKAQLMQIGNVKLKALSEQFKAVGDKVKTVGQNFTRYVSAPIGAGLVASAKSAITFGDAIAKVSTIADSSEVPIKTLKDNIIALSNESGKSANDLAEATYQALSASVATKDVSNFVRQATGLAKAGFLDTAGAVDVLTTIINAYGMSAKDADTIANQLIQTQNDGKTTVNELAEAMGNVIPTAAALNVPLEQLNAAYVQLTKQGINTNNATTSINAMLNELSKSGSKTAQILQSETGKTFGQLMSEGYSLGDILKILSDSVDGNSEAFKNLFGNVRAGKGALALLNGGIDEFNAETEKMLNSTGNVNKALNDLSTPGASARKALTQLVNVGIQIGDVLAPYIQKAATWIQKVVEKFNSLDDSTKKIIVTIAGILAVAGPILVIVGTLISSIGAVIGVIGMLTPAIAGIGILIAGAVAIIIWFIQHWDELKAELAAFTEYLASMLDALNAKITEIWNSIKAFLVGIWDGIKATALAVWDGIKVGITAIVQAVVTSVQTWFNNLKNNVTIIWNAIKSTATTVWNSIKSAITGPIEEAKTKVKGILEKIKDFFPIKIGKIFTGIKLPHFTVSGGEAPWGIGGKGSLPKWNVDWYAKGGIFSSPSIIGVGEAGSEAVVPLDKFWDKLDNMGGETNIVINVNGANKDPVQIAEEVKRILISETNRRRMAWQ